MEAVKNYLLQVNWVDVLFVICLIRTSYIGFSRGFTSEIPRLVCIFFTIVLSYRFFGRLGQFLSGYPGIRSEAADNLAFLVLVLFFGLLSWLVCVIYRIIMKAMGPQSFESFAGFILGIIRGIAIASLLLVCIEHIAPGYAERSIRQRSVTGSRLIAVAPAIDEFTNSLVDR